MNLDPERIQSLVGAIVGGAVYGIFHLATLLLSGKPTTGNDYLRAGLNMGVAILIGMLAAPILGPALTAAIPWVSLRDPHAVGFCIGAFGWELLPLAFEIAKKRANKLGDQ